MKTKYDALATKATRAGSGRNIDKKWQKPCGTWVVGEILGQRLTIEILRLDPSEYDDESEPERLAGYYAAANPEAIGSLIADVKALAEALQELTDDIVDRFDMESPSTNPGIKHCISQARAALSRIQGEAG